MAKNTRFVGMDVHAETLAVAVGEGRGQVRSLGTIPNRGEAVERLLKKLGKPGELVDRTSISEGSGRSEARPTASTLQQLVSRPRAASSRF